MKVEDAIRQRRSIRRFKQTPVPEEKIRAVLDSALIAPSARNGLDLRFCVVSSPEKCREVFRNTAWAAAVKPKRDPVENVSAPTFYIIVSSVGSPGFHAWANAGAAIENMLLSAVGLGLGGCWIGSFNRNILERTISQPEGLTAMYVVAFGVPDETPVSERIGIGDNTKYYLDSDDVLHVPKYTADAAARFL